MLDPAELSNLLAEGREAAGDIMTTRCRITRAAREDKGAFNESTGRYARPTGTLIYEGPGRIQIRSDVNSNVVEVTAGEREWAYTTSTLSVPVTAQEALAVDPGSLGDPANVATDDTVEILAEPANPALVGRLYQVRAIKEKTHSTARALRITEAVG